MSRPGEGAHPEEPRPECPLTLASLTLRLPRARREALSPHAGRGVGAPRRQIPPQLVRLAHGGRETDRRQPRRERVEAGEAEGEKIAALRGHERVQFVEDHALQAGKQRPRLAVREEQRELFGRGQQDVGRALDLARALVGGGVARAGLDADRQRHLAHGRLKVARDVDGQRLEGRDVKGVKARIRRRGGLFRQFDQRRQKPRERLAGAGRRDQQDRAPGLRLGQEVELVGAGRPAAAGEPRQKSIGQGRGLDATLGHAPKLTPERPSLTSFMSGRRRIRRTVRGRDRRPHSSPPSRTRAQNPSTLNA